MLPARQMVYATAGRDKTIRLWSAVKHSCIGEAKLHKGITALDFHPSGKYLAVGLSQSDLVVLRVDGAAERSEKLHLIPIAKRSTLGPQKATATDSKTPASSNAPSKSVNNQDQSVTCMKYSPNGHFLVAGSHTRLIRSPFGSLLVDCYD